MSLCRPFWFWGPTATPIIIYFHPRGVTRLGMCYVCLLYFCHSHIDILWTQSFWLFHLYIHICLNILWTQFSWLFHLYIEVVYYVVIDRFNTLWTQSAVLFHLLSNCILHFINTLYVYLCYSLSMCPSILRVYCLTLVLIIGKIIFHIYKI